MGNSMEPPEIITVDASETEIACDGGKLFGHPKVYLNIGDSGYVDCYYCGRRFLRGFSEEQHTDSSAGDDHQTV